MFLPPHTQEHNRDYKRADLQHFQKGSYIQFPTHGKLRPSFTKKTVLAVCVTL